ncbi:MAG: Spy/CpxP family protein refolding chaperone [Proteobacteria bacterium]|nr:Spy/CpxP family protein refolding chaperone [Pseudomonadota bacterium]MBI3499114.1 Spy/CpxP family protein refolding chaperone [Pseudomonadota bacterium]
MRKYYTLLIAGLLSLSLGAGIVFETAIANAPVELAQAPSPPPPGPRPERPLPGRFIEGRIAFLKAELHITDAQLPLWEPVAKAMREAAAKRADLYRQMRASQDQPLHAPERLERRVSAAQQGIQQTQALLAALTPLYGSMSDEQKAAADLLLAPGPMAGGRPPHRGPF